MLWLVRQYRRGAAGWRSQLQSQGGPLLAHQSHVQPALQDESSVEHGGDRRLLQRREVPAASCQTPCILDPCCQSDRCVWVCWNETIFNQSAILLSSSFLGYVDKLGVAYEAPTVATGFGAYLAQVSEFVLLLLVCSWTLYSGSKAFLLGVPPDKLKCNLNTSHTRSCWYKTWQLRSSLEKMSHSVGVTEWSFFPHRGSFVKFRHKVTSFMLFCQHISH